jgi:hypothetical protein
MAEVTRDELDYAIHTLSRDLIDLVKGRSKADLLNARAGALQAFSLAKIALYSAGPEKESHDEHLQRLLNAHMED